jgi:hypothetical protein
MPLRLRLHLATHVRPSSRATLGRDDLPTGSRTGAPTLPRSRRVGAPPPRPLAPITLRRHVFSSGPRGAAFGRHRRDAPSRDTAWAGVQHVHNAGRGSHALTATSSVPARTPAIRALRRLATPRWRLREPCHPHLQAASPVFIHGGSQPRRSTTIPQPQPRSRAPPSQPLRHHAPFAVLRPVEACLHELAMPQKPRGRDVVLHGWAEPSSDAVTPGSPRQALARRRHRALPGPHRRPLLRAQRPNPAEPGPACLPPSCRLAAPW